METKIENKDDINERLDKICDLLKGITNAFTKTSDGIIDFDGHRRYHESIIRAANAQEKFWIDLKLEIAKKGIWGLLVIIVGLIVVGVTTKLGFVK